MSKATKDQSRWVVNVTTVSVLFIIVILEEKNLYVMLSQ